MSSLKNQADQLDSSITIRLSTAEKLELREDADIAGVSVSEIVRRQYFNRPIVAKEDRIFIKGQHRILMELRRVGGLLKRVHVESGGIYADQTSEALRTVNATVESVRVYMEVLADGR